VRTVGGYQARFSRFATVLAYQAPPRAVRMPRALRASATAASVVAPEALMLSTIGRTFAAKRLVSAVIATRPMALASATFVVAELDALRLLRGEGCLGALGDHGPLLLRQGGEKMQHEWIAVGAKLGDHERDALGHQARHEGNVTGQAVELGDEDGAFGAASGRQGSGQLRPAIEGVLADPNYLAKILNLSPH
jgi:hypothetical protein